MRRCIFAVAAIVAAVTSASAQPIGSVKICRAPGIIGLHQQDTIPIPAGALLVNPGDFNTVSVTTTKSVTLERGSNCVVAPASVKQGAAAVKVAQELRPSGASGNRADKWMFTAEYKITVESAFK